MKKRIAHFLALVLAASTSYGQSELTVNCYDTYSPYNLFSIDNTVIEYNVCGLQPAFYVGVIDPSTCSAWGTNYNGANPSHSFGNLNEGTCRPRVEYYFAFDAGDSLQLEGMRTMLQQLPSGHSVLIYTPIQYHYSEVHAVNSNLTQELESRWNPSVIQGNDIMILYGVAGDVNSFVEETTLNSGQVSFTTTIGCDASLSVNDLVLEEKLFVKQDGMSFTLNPALPVSDLQIMDATGKTVSFTRTDDQVQLQAGTSAGVYLFQATVSGKMYRSKQLISCD